MGVLTTFDTRYGDSIVYTENYMPDIWPMCHS